MRDLVSQFVSLLHGCISHFCSAPVQKRKHGCVSVKCYKTELAVVKIKKNKKNKRRGMKEKNYCQFCSNNSQFAQDGDIHVLAVSPRKDIAGNTVSFQVAKRAYIPN